jgi:hypothetical protein
MLHVAWGMASHVVHGISGNGTPMAWLLHMQPRILIDDNRERRASRERGRERREADRAVLCCRGWVCAVLCSELS